MSFESSIKEKLNKLQSLSRKKETIIDLGVTALKLIYGRTKSGYGVNDDRLENPSIQRLNSLSPKYIIHRIRNRTELGEFASPAKSNLTYTGQMLDALEAKTEDGEIELTVNNNVRRNGKNTNQEVVKYVTENGRPFFALTSKDKKILINDYRRIVKSIAQQIFR